MDLMAGDASQGCMAGCMTDARKVDWTRELPWS